MSRCFPFPPPGYDKKDKLDDANLLAKHKEKKHKKDKKEKDRKEGKDKEDKYRSEEKKKEQKDRKVKHKHKKEKHRDKEKKKTSDEKKSLGSSDCQNGKILGPSCMQIDDETKILLELGKRINDDGAEQNQAVKKIIVINQKYADVLGKVEERNRTSAEGNGKSNIRPMPHREDRREVSGQNIRTEARDLENGFLWNLTGRKAGEVVRQVDKVTEQQINLNEKNTNKHEDSAGDRPKHRDEVKKSTSKHKKGGKEKKSTSKHKKGEKEKKGKELKGVETNKEQLISRENGRTVTDLQNTEPDHSKGRNKSSSINGTLGKRKLPETNGIIHDIDIRPPKLSKIPSFSHPVVENGKVLELSQFTSQIPLELEGKVKKSWVDNKVLSSNLANGRKSESRQSPPIQAASERQGTIQNHQMAIKVLPSHLILKNQRKLEECHPIVHSVSERQGTSVNHKISMKVSPSQSLVENQRKLEAGQLIFQPESERQGITENHQVAIKVSSSHPLVGKQKKLETCQLFQSAASEGQGPVENHKMAVKVSPSVSGVDSQRKPEAQEHINQLTFERLKTIENCKLAIKVSPSRPHMENQKKPEAHQSIIPQASEKQAVVGNHEVNENKEHSDNGLRKTQQSSIGSSKANLLQVKDKVVASSKPPHPDSIYLSQLLSVPKVEFSNLDDQEWLFNNGDLSTKMPKLDSPRTEVSKQPVWDEAVRIGSIDVIALPYVIPY